MGPRTPLAPRPSHVPRANDHLTAVRWSLATDGHFPRWLRDRHVAVRWPSPSRATLSGGCRHLAAVTWSTRWRPCKTKRKRKRLPLPAMWHKSAARQCLAAFLEPQGNSKCGAQEFRNDVGVHSIRQVFVSGISEWKWNEN